MEKVIFLDIDGVLATHKEFWVCRPKYYKKYPEAEELKIPYPFNKGCVKVLNEILEKTDAEIVLSSDWRTHWTLDELDKIFKFNKVIKSPVLVTSKECSSMSNLERNRAYQIGIFLNEFKPKYWVAIDDLNMKPYMSITNDDDKMFVTRDNEGLKQTGLKEKIIRKLNPTI